MSARRDDRARDTIMASRAFEQPVRLDAPVVEALEEAAGPLPRLKPTGRSRSIELLAVVLDNGLLKATVVPALGGRIVSIVDLGSGTEMLPQGAMSVLDEGPRGAWSPDGVQFYCDDRRSRTSMGTSSTSKIRCPAAMARCMMLY